MKSTLVTYRRHDKSTKTEIGSLQDIYMSGSLKGLVLIETGEIISVPLKLIRVRLDNEEVRTLNDRKRAVKELSKPTKPSFLGRLKRDRS